MLNKLIELSIKTRVVIVLILLAVSGMGIYEYITMPVDAFPDISPVMVPVFAEAHGMAPEEIERLITYPIESSMNGLPGVTNIKSTSAFGMCVIYVYFDDNTDIYFARQLVSERLTSAMAELPPLHEPPVLGPISTGLGQVFLYYLTLDENADTEGKDRDLYLREVNDWIVKFQLKTVSGVTDILSIGGYVTQYQIQLNPEQMNRFGITLDEVCDAVNQNNKNAGGQFLLLGSEEYLVRGVGMLQTLEDIENIVIHTEPSGTVRIRDISRVQYGRELRRGVVTHNGAQEVVSGIVLKLYGENTSKVIEKLYERIDSLKQSLPEGVRIIPYYEQAELVHNATWTIKKALLEGAVLVMLVLMAFLGNFRSAVIVTCALPFCCFVAFICMKFWGISANLMSLGGIAIGLGMLVDGAIVMVENIYRHFSSYEDRNMNKAVVIYEASREVSRPIIFSILIVVVVMLPIFTLEGVEGKMFSPMAYTISFALAGSILMAVIAVPVLSFYFLRQGAEKEQKFMSKIIAVYEPLLEKAVSNFRVVTVSCVVIFIAALFCIPFLGTEFIPVLEEGSIFISVAMAPSISLEKATETVMKMEQIIIKRPEVRETVSRIGRPETGSHPHPVNYAEIHIELNPQKQWKLKSKQELEELLHEELAAVPGAQLNFTQPIQNAFDELLSGIKAQLAIKLFGDDLDILRAKSAEIYSAVKGIKGLADVSVEQSYGQPQVQIAVDRKKCSAYGVNPADIMLIIETAVGGEVIDNMYLNSRRFGIHIRYGESYRNTAETLKRILISAENQKKVMLSDVADISDVLGPIQINREKNQRRWVIQGNIRGRDLGSVFTDIKSRVENIKLPPGYYVEYGGQFENQQRAMKRLMIIVPVVVLIVFVMLLMALQNTGHAFIVIANIPFSLIGGVAGLIITREYLSVPASIGFIALFGIAMQDGLVLVSCITERMQHTRNIPQAVIQGCLMRIRPVLMTTATTLLGLLPLLLSAGTGADVQRPLAAVVVFGLASSTILTLLVLPSVFAWYEEKRPKHAIDLESWGNIYDRNIHE